MNAPELVLAPAEEISEIGSWIRTNIRSFNEQFLGEHTAKHVATVAKVDGQFVGGMVGVVVLDWLSVDMVFLDEAYRGSGLRTKLLNLLEEEGRRLGATRAFVDTTSFQAEGFYAKFGYLEWGRFVDFAPGIDRIYMRKDKL